jgi:hypothetical protein
MFFIHPTVKQSLLSLDKARMKKAQRKAGINTNFSNISVALFVIWKNIFLHDVKR